MTNFSTSVSWIVAGTLLFILATYALIHLWKGQGDEVPDPEVEYKHYVEPTEVEVYNPLAIYPIEELEIIKLEKYEQMYNHFKYAEKGLTFKDYIRKVECGTWGELAD